MNVYASRQAHIRYVLETNSHSLINSTGSGTPVKAKLAVENPKVGTHFLIRQVFFSRHFRHFGGSCGFSAF